MLLFCIQERCDLESRYLCSLLLEPRSLLVLQDKMYTWYQHGIAERTTDAITAGTVCNLNQCRIVGGAGERGGGEGGGGREGGRECGEITLPRGTRVSLTIRHVPRTLKVKLTIGK